MFVLINLLFNFFGTLKRFFLKLQLVFSILLKRYNVQIISIINNFGIFLIKHKVYIISVKLISVYIYKFYQPFFLDGSSYSKSEWLDAMLFLLASCIFFYVLYSVLEFDVEDSYAYFIVASTIFCHFLCMYLYHFNPYFRVFADVTWLAYFLSFSSFIKKRLFVLIFFEKVQKFSSFLMVFVFSRKKKK